MTELSNKRILLGVTGGIAAYKSAELLRELQRQGADVQVIMTESACRFVTPVTMQALSGKPVFTDMWDSRTPNGMPHIELSRDRDIIVVAPATAGFIAKLVHGAADDLLSTLCLARECPLMVAPAMNRQMWENPATQRNIEQLHRDGLVVLGPDSGDQACGETGMGRMLEPADLARSIGAWFQPKLLAGTHVLITAGPTFEPIDPVRGITNRSSGKMGYAVARAALEAGAQVTLISGPVSLEAPASTHLVRVETARQMLDAVNAHVVRCDIFVGVAAVADYHVSNNKPQKIKKDGAIPTLELVPNPDIIEEVARRPNPPFCVGFAAESENLEQNAEAKRRRKKLPLLAANLAQAAIGADESELVLFDDDGVHRMVRASKIELARALIRHIAKLYRPRKTPVTA
ncbi:MAG TPA: bifunctional phosphopantothenoylcysteine decarboxylase/phosphopantothenate--cysteine ligase CoaBC [Burkholderiales bacterium]|jgi:phosphopantothenoylcysteine decarboxylase/phosphopantothenate--cysteine ligase|nr:bifunctional phosphopantothenoylcysteine decarboxylase/phosphopantothenate--cysteine ligase CoaBC [Burkholderiales bacterium]